ncbi:hypothetical protein [Endozoicomonas euniceicola]|uniref:Fido domain-containing protein n=1 Tax=Endozoicomonas euniceicola TaxID=1234143 RepID=A0ABY6H218_9GAMM|nr:hypothetical protein [Endozoicomonas euniceicola]UYM18199.1 hypothetical protein NX720_09930 [Endozoicomonas euniceicola]
MHQASHENILERCDELIYFVEHPPEYHQHTGGTKLFMLKACSILLSEMNLKEIKKAIGDIESGKHSVSSRLLSLLKGIYNAQQESFKVQDMLDSSELCKGFRVEQLYRLFIDEGDWKKYGLKMFCYEDEPGYAAAMLKAFRSVGDILGSGKLDIDKIKQIYRLATSDVLSSKSGNIISDELKEEETSCDLVNNNNYDRAENFTEKGLGEVREVASQNKYPEIGLRESQQLRVLHDHKNNRGFQLSNEFCQTFEAELQQIKESPNQGVEQESQKIACIAKVCRNIQFTHPFRDGNARTIGCILVNGLLMREGLSPSLINNANKFDAYSVDELVKVIRLGQSHFNALKNRF